MQRHFSYIFKNNAGSVYDRFGRFVAVVRAVDRSFAVGDGRRSVRGGGAGGDSDRREWADRGAADRFDESGRLYTLRPLAIGKYTVEIERPGFRRERYNDVELTTGQAREFNAKLEVGPTSESVTMTERPSLLGHAEFGREPVDRGQAVLDDRLGVVRVGSPAANAITFFETNRRTGYSQQFSLRVQQEHQLRPKMMQARSGQAQRPFPQFSKFGVSFPGSKGRRFLTGGFGGKVFGAWTIGAVMLLQSGPPILVATQQSRSGADSRTPGEQSKHVVDSNVSLS